jgi:ATP-binding cassette subfamily B protein
LHSTNNYIWRIHINHFSFLYYYLKKHSIKLIIGFIFIGIQNYSLVKISEYIKLLYNEVAGSNIRTEVISLSAFFFMWLAIAGISMFIMRNLIISVSRYIEFEIRDRIYNKLLVIEYMYFKNNNTGDIISRCTNDLNDVRLLLGPGIMYIPNSLSRILIFIPALITLQADVLKYMYSVLLGLIVLILVVLPLTRPFFLKIQKQIAYVSSFVWETVTGILTIKAYTAEKIFKERFHNINEEYVKRSLTVSKFESLLWPLFITVFSSTGIILLWKGGGYVISSEMEKGELIQYRVVMTMMTFTILSLGWVMSKMQPALTALGRIREILDFKEEQTSDVNKTFGSINAITVECLTHKYRDKSFQALDQVSVIFKKGETIGITGTIGSGKSTLMQCIAGIIPVSDKTIFFNQTDINTLSPSGVKRNVSFVPQDTFLFSRTILENITFGDVMPDTVKAESAAKKAAVYNEIISFPNGFNEIIGERGVTLSGGQRQRIAIARALYHDADVYIFDDALSSVDTNTEDSILSVIHSIAREDKICIIVSHRIKALAECSNIIVLDNGVVSEKGSHSYLIQNNGVYKRLAEIQEIEQTLKGNGDMPNE